MLSIFKKEKNVAENAFLAVASGKIIPLEKVKDEVFAQKMLGDGAAIIPEGEWIVAPCKGQITMLYPTLHAFSIKNEAGVDILVHIGINTVSLNGKGFKAFVKEGDRIQAGDKIIRFDSYMMDRDGLDMTTMMLFPSASDIKLSIKREGRAKKGETEIVTYHKI